MKRRQYKMEGNRISMSSKGLSFDVNGGSNHINVIVNVEEFDDGQLIISAKYGDEDVGRRVTSIANYKIVE
jgi:hypothetical protein